jgi:two-component system response regulator HydG
VDAPVLIRGESGTGKELVARAIHEAGLRAASPFVAVNCTSLPQELLESELFGHAKGAFTGAANARRGLFLEADGGTLFLDEIGDMPAELQAKLLRVLQEKEIRPVGSDASRKVDVRIIAATHQPLEDLIKSGKFREDLFFRLDVLNVQVPALRERREDIETLTRHFFDKYRLEFKSSVRELPSELLERFLRAPWVGNVRELENAVQRYVILGEFDPVQSHAEDSAPLDLFNLREVEDRHIRRVLDYCGGNKTQAAELLGIDASTIHRKLSRP